MTDRNATDITDDRGCAFRVTTRAATTNGHAAVTVSQIAGPVMSKGYCSFRHLPDGLVSSEPYITCTGWCWTMKKTREIIRAAGHAF